MHKAVNLYQGLWILVYKQWETKKDAWEKDAFLEDDSVCMLNELDKNV